jgi:hypothetical protein
MAYLYLETIEDGRAGASDRSPEHWGSLEREECEDLDAGRMRVFRFNSETGAFEEYAACGGAWKWVPVGVWYRT